MPASIGCKANEGADTASIVSNGYNLSTAHSCWPFLTHPHDIKTASAELGSLAGNGGPTLTHLPQAGSPLIDAGACMPDGSTDQRGVPRPQGVACDIGAVEVQVSSPNTIVPRARIPIVVK